MKLVKSTRNLTKPIATPEKLQFLYAKFHREMNILRLERCNLCNEINLTRSSKLSFDKTVCHTCKIKLKHNSSGYISTVPVPFPQILREYALTFLEEQFIALLFVNTYIFDLKTTKIITIGLFNSLFYL